VLFAYFGPETFLPVTSAIAGVVGVLLMFGRSSIRLLLDGARRVVGRGAGKSAVKSTVPSRPHLNLTSNPRAHAETSESA
jgi:hypothetical protein